MLPMLEDAGVRPIIACFYRRSEGVERSVLDRGTDVRFLDGRRLPGRVRALRRIIRDESVAVVHTTLFEANLAGRLAAAGTPATVLTSLVNTTYATSRLEDPNLNPALMAVLRRVDAWTSKTLTAHLHAITHAAK